jgi:hypothetical protein
MLESQKRGSIATAKYFPKGYIVQQLFATVCITYGGIAYRSCSQSVCLSNRWSISWSVLAFTQSISSG